jgi:hypothetical protein
MGSRALDTGTVVFLRLHSADDRTLIPMRVVELGASVFTAECEGIDLDAAAGTDAYAYYKHEGTFLRQRIRIDAIMPSESRTVIGFSTFGKPERADARRSQRVPTHEARLLATFDDEESCPLLDVSLEGFAVIARTAREVGELLPVTLFYDDERFSGTACVQNVQRLPDGRFRHGLQSVGDRIRGGSLQRGQLQIGIGIQRAELDQITSA